MVCIKFISLTSKTLDRVLDLVLKVQAEQDRLNQLQKQYEELVEFDSQQEKKFKSRSSLMSHKSEEFNKKSQILRELNRSIT